MKRKHNKSIKLFTTAFIQVFLVSANTYFISRLMWIGIAACGFGISYMWTVNVKKVACSNIHDRLVYSLGAMSGGLLGVFISKLVVNSNLFNYVISYLPGA